MCVCYLSSSRSQNPSGCRARMRERSAFNLEFRLVSKCALSGHAPVAFVEWRGGHICESYVWHIWAGTIFGSRPSVKPIPIYAYIRVTRGNLAISIMLHSVSFPACPHKYTHTYIIYMHIYVCELYIDIYR